MPLRLVGETIDKTRSHYLAESGIDAATREAIATRLAEEYGDAVWALAVRRGCRDPNA